MSETVNGRIIKGIAGFYYVYVENKGVIECKAKGLFRNQKIKPLVGDSVVLQIIDDENKLGNIESINSRKNQLLRPAVANVDQAVVIFAVAQPEPHLNLLDRFLILMEKQQVPVIIVFNKTDLAEESETACLRQIYEKAGYSVLTANAVMGIGVEEIRRQLDGKTTVLAGPSGVGKSTVMNHLQPAAAMETGAVSEKIKRGKHTTRHTELVYLSPGTYLLDTPGFSSLYVEDVEAGDLWQYYPEFVKYEDQCRFVGCSHIKEPDCAVKNALAEGLIAKERYDNYCKLYAEAAGRKKY
ncbi:MAG: ribosome small subunit-dependent GTPase A [Lachnospiraceae bacterium]